MADWAIVLGMFGAGFSGCGYAIKRLFNRLEDEHDLCKESRDKCEAALRECVEDRIDCERKTTQLAYAVHKLSPKSNGGKPSLDSKFEEIMEDTGLLSDPEMYAGG